MSRTSQKKFSAYQQGVDDGLLDLEVRWVRHPQLQHYIQGYHVGRSARVTMPPPKMTFGQRVIFALFGLAPDGKSYLP